MTIFDVMLDMAGIYLSDGRPLSMFVDQVMDHYTDRYTIKLKNGFLLSKRFYGCSLNTGTSKVSVTERFFSNKKDLFEYAAKIYKEE